MNARTAPQSLFPGDILLAICDRFERLLSLLHLALPAHPARFLV